MSSLTISLLAILFFSFANGYFIKRRNDFDNYRPIKPLNGNDFIADNYQRNSYDDDWSWNAPRYETRDRGNGFIADNYQRKPYDDNWNWDLPRYEKRDREQILPVQREAERRWIDSPRQDIRPALEKKSKRDPWLYLQMQLERERLEQAKKNKKH